jgi:hypothetical protein
VLALSHLLAKAALSVWALSWELSSRAMYPETMAGNLATQLFLMNNQAKHRSWIVRQIYGTTTGQQPKELLDKLRHFKPLDGLFSNSHHQMALVRVIPHYQRSVPAS